MSPLTNDNLPGIPDPASPRTAESREYASCERTHATGTTHYHPLRVKTLIDKFEDRRALTSPPPDDERLRAALDFIADWAHDCISDEDTASGYGFADIEKMARAALSPDDVPYPDPRPVLAVQPIVEPRRRHPALPDDGREGLRRMPRIGKDGRCTGCGKVPTRDTGRCRCG